MTEPPGTVHQHNDGYNMNKKTYFKIGALLIAALGAALWQLFGDASAGVCLATGAAITLSPEELASLKGTLVELKTKLTGSAEDIAKIAGIEKLVKSGEDAQKKQADEIATLKSEGESMKTELTTLRKQFAQRGAIGGNVRRKGFLTDAAAKSFASVMILGLARKGAFEKLDDGVLKACRDSLGFEQKTALTTSDIGLPTEYTQELKELVAEYGVARRVMSPYPIVRGVSKPARLGTQDDFTFPVAMSAALTEKNVKLGNASLESHKGGGIIRIPREIDEQGIIPLGQMLARYAARKFGKVEDSIAFLGDGTATYDSIKGVCQIAADNTYVKTLGATKTAPSDATLADLRDLRSIGIASPIIGSGSYYFHITWERRLRELKTQADPMIYVQNGPNGTPTLDGYPVIWSEIMTPYGSLANASKYIAVFGDLSYWWFGEHGSPRTDFSTDVFFTTDELAVRWLEEIDFDYAAPDCASALKTAAA